MSGYIPTASVRGRERGSITHFGRQIRAVILLVYVVELTILQVGRDPLVELRDQTRLALSHADREIQVADGDLRLEGSALVLLPDLIHDRRRGCDNVGLTGDGGSDHGRVIVVAGDLEILVLGQSRELRVLSR